MGFHLSPPFVPVPELERGPGPELEHQTLRLWPDRVNGLMLSTSAQSMT
jgi:hypothetical protein